MRTKPIIIGIAGGSGSGKTTMVEAICKSTDTSIVVINHDAYYWDQRHLSREDLAKCNYDHPDALENSLLVKHLNDLLAGDKIEMPQYDFCSHQRKDRGIFRKPSSIVIVEGLLVLALEEIRALMDLKIFIDVDDDVRLIRRLIRDERERGIPMTTNIENYLGSIRDMHKKYVATSKSFADLLIPENFGEVAIEVVVSFIQMRLHPNVA